MRHRARSVEEPDLINKLAMITKPEHLLPLQVSLLWASKSMQLTSLIVVFACGGPVYQVFTIHFDVCEQLWSLAQHMYVVALTNLQDAFDNALMHLSRKPRYAQDMYKSMTPHRRLAPKEE